MNEIYISVTEYYHLTIYEYLPATSCLYILNTQESTERVSALVSTPDLFWKVPGLSLGLVTVLTKTFCGFRHSF